MKKTDSVRLKRSQPSSQPSNRTQHDLAADIRSAVSELLQARLSDAIDLMLQTKQAHWTIRGPQFAGLHTLFDTVHEDITEFVDLLAERAAILGAQVKGTVRISAKNSKLTEYPLDIRSGSEHVKALSQRLVQFAHLIRQNIDDADALGDKVTADLFTEIARRADLRLWMVEAHDG